MRRAWPVIVLSFLCWAAPAQEIRAPYKALSDSVSRITGFPLTYGNSVQCFQSGETFLASLLKDIEAAKECIDLEYYWVSNDKVGRAVRDALVKKAEEGLAIRVVADNCITPLIPKAYFRKLQKAGAAMYYSEDFKKVRLWELPGMVLGRRDHRKIVVLDGRVCYTGGMNLCHYIMEWDDTHLRIEGPFAASLDALFEQTWQYVARGTEDALGSPEAAAAAEAFPVVPVEAENPLPDKVSGIYPNVMAQLVYGDGSPALEDIYIQMLNSVQRYIYLRTPYLVPPPRFLQALYDTACRGVDVRILLPFESDWPFMNDITRYFYQTLHEAGVRLYTYAPTYDHTKGFVADDYLGSFGTVNLDNRSFYINLEDTVFFYDESLARYAVTEFLTLLEEAEEVLSGDARITGLEKTWINFLLSIQHLL